MNLLTRLKNLSSDSIKKENHFLYGLIQLICTCIHTLKPQAGDRLVAGSLPTTILRSTMINILDKCLTCLMRLGLPKIPLLCILLVMDRIGILGLMQIRPHSAVKKYQLGRSIPCSIACAMAREDKGWFNFQQHHSAP